MPAVGPLTGITPGLPGGLYAWYNITAPTVVKASPGMLCTVSVIVAGSGSTAGTVNDAATTGGASAANQIASFTNTLTTRVMNWPCVTGIVVVPGSGQTLAVAFT